MQHYRLLKPYPRENTIIVFAWSTRDKQRLPAQKRVSQTTDELGRPQIAGFSSLAAPRLSLKSNRFSSFVGATRRPP